MRLNQGQGQLSQFSDQLFEAAVFLGPLFDLGEHIYRDVNGMGFAFELPSEVMARVLVALSTAAVGIATGAADGDEAGGQADAAAKYQDAGVSAEQNVKGSVSLQDGTVSGGTSTDVRAGTQQRDATTAGLATRGGMEIYQFTESGIALQATVAGTKYWQDSKLNQ